MRDLLPSYLATFAAAIALAGCYGPNVAPGAQACSADGQCPAGLSCFGDKRCYPTGSNPDCNPPCGGAKPLCDKSTLQCVACLADNDCGAGSLCVKETCMPGCSAAHPACAGDAGRCDVDMGVCRGCSSDAECTDPANPRCDAPSGRCVPCLPKNDNCPQNQFCAQSGDTYGCVAGCKTRADCVPAMDQPMPDLAMPDDGGGANNPDGASTDMAGGDGASSTDMAGASDMSHGDGWTPPDMATPPPANPAAMDCCDHKCVDTSADDKNCGACGQPCGAGDTCCDSQCKDFATDLANCGGCGKACALQNVIGPMCALSNCDYGTCGVGFGDCDANRTNGCETDIAHDTNDCGTCGHACGPYAHAAPACDKAACKIAVCDPGFADCDNGVADGCEVDINGDPENCGGCGKACGMVVNGVAGCSVGQCVVGRCNNPFRDCDGNFQNGCESDILTDVKNCGSCGAPCATPPNASVSCQAGSCKMGPCNAGFADCDKNPANGCEVNINTDVRNCGGCGMACAPSQATGVCAGGHCAIQACNAGFADCDKNPANGCEYATANFQSDPNNCGKCGNVCPAFAPSCTNGACRPIGPPVCNPACLNGGVCVANNTCQTPPHAPGTFGPMHTFAGATSDFFISTGQGNCSVNSMQNAAVDAQYFCTHFYGPNCSVQPGYFVTMRSGNKMHKNSGCTSSGNDIPNTVCDSPNAPGMPCKMWIASAEVDSGLANLVCVCQ